MADKNLGPVDPSGNYGLGQAEADKAKRQELADAKAAEGRAKLAEYLNEMEDRPWPEYGRSRKPITTVQIARLLRRHAISPNSIRYPRTLTCSSPRPAPASGARWTVVRRGASARPISRSTSISIRPTRHGTRR